MDPKYYQEALYHLRELAAEFARAHPAMAPMLSGTSQDPDVERVLEGTAFMTGMLREKIDDDFPEIIQGLMQLVFPHYLQPIPAATLIAFTPKPNLTQCFTVAAGTAIDSVPVQGKACRFQTCGDVAIHPLRITDVRTEEKIGENPLLRIQFQLFGLELDQWQPGRLRLHFPGPIGEAADLYALLMRHTLNIRFVPAEGGRSAAVSPDCLRGGVFEDREVLLPHPGQSLPVYRLIQEFFILPEKFLFIDVSGWPAWTGRGTGSRFAVEFELDGTVSLPRHLKTEDIALFVTPAINLFSHEAVPVALDHRRTEYRIIPSGKTGRHYSVFSVEKVRGIVRGTTRKKTYHPFEHFQDDVADSGSYFLRRRTASANQPPEVLISFGYPETEEIQNETLSIELLCTNGEQPAALQAGDICKATSTSPERCTFGNIRYPTKTAYPPLDRNLLWRLLSHMSVNLLSVMDAGNLRTLLRLYVDGSMQDQGVVQANLKRVNAIAGVTCKPGDRVIRGGVIRGFEIAIRIHSGGFASPGDFFLFTAVLDRFFAEYAGFNSYTRLTVIDELSGETIQWPIRIGKQRPR